MSRNEPYGQDSPMFYDPMTGKLLDTIQQTLREWRQQEGGAACLFNPWTGCLRDARDVGSDTQGVLIQQPRISVHPSLRAPLLSISGDNNEPLVSLDYDGTLTFGSNYTPHGAAKLFWDAIAGAIPKHVQQPVTDHQPEYHI